MTLKALGYLAEARIALSAFLQAARAQGDAGSTLRAQLGESLVEEIQGARSLVRATEERLANPGRMNQLARAAVFNAVSDHALDARTFAATVRDEYADAFARHQRIAEYLEPIVASSRTIDGAFAFALDLLCRQAYTAHHSVRVLAELGHGEDAATIARRMLELAVRGKYLSAEGKPQGKRKARVHDYLARLWRRLPEELRKTIPDHSTSAWFEAEQGLEQSGDKKPPRWLDMFDDIGHRQLYVSDYGDLSAIAHGSPYTAPLQYAGDVVPLRDVRWTNAVLNAANRYYLAVAMVWNDEFHLADDTQLQLLSVAEIPAPPKTRASMANDDSVQTESGA